MITFRSNRGSVLLYSLLLSALFLTFINLGMQRATNYVNVIKVYTFYASAKNLENFFGTRIDCKYTLDTSWDICENQTLTKRWIPIYGRDGLMLVRKFDGNPMKATTMSGIPLRGSCQCKNSKCKILVEGNLPTNPTADFNTKKFSAIFDGQGRTDTGNPVVYPRIPPQACERGV